MQNILLVLVLLLLGISFRFLAGYHQRNPDASAWLFGVPKGLADALTSFVIYVSLPALILARIPSLEMSGDLLVPVVMPWIMLALSVLLVLILCRVFGWEGKIKALLLLLVPLGNTSFLGLPMVEAFFGEEYVRYALLYDQLGTFLALATYGTVVIGLYGEQPEEAVRLEQRVGKVILRIVAFPPFIALLLAFSTRSLTYPQPLLSTLELLGATLIPLVMVAVGFKIQFRINPAHRLVLGTGLALKLVVTPLLALAGCRLLGLNGSIVDVSVFEAGMPSMVAAWAVAMKAGFEPELGAALVGFGILISFATLSGLFQLF